MMIANGVRLLSASQGYQEMIKPEMWVFQYGIINCRTAVITLLRLKRLGLLKHWDRFLIKEVAFAVWASRREKEWQNETGFKMSGEGSDIDWRAFLEASKYGRLMELLLTLPLARWKERSPGGQTLFHFAAIGTNVVALVALIQSGLDVNARDRLHNTPVHYAARYQKPRALELLCAAGAELRARNGEGRIPLDYALRYGDFASARVLVANGVRLSTANNPHRILITPELVAFERGVLRCRAAVVALLQVKRKANLWRWDKFLLKEVAFVVWASRREKEWQK